MKEQQKKLRKRKSKRRRAEIRKISVSYKAIRSKLIEE
jgi:hypothetical protein